MPRYRKKPVEIVAIQFTGGLSSAHRVWSWAGRNSGVTVPRDPTHHIEIKTLEGVMRANAGDWIICGVNGEFYPCKPDIFEATYDPVD